MTDEMSDMYHILKEDLTVFKASQNDSDRDTLEKDFALVVPLDKELHDGVGDNLSMADADFRDALSALEFNDDKTFGENMTNALNNIPV